VKPGQRRAGCLLCGGHVAAGCGGGVGSLLALVPLLVAATAILTTFLLILGLTELTDVSVFVEYLVALIGLGVAIDYSLLLVTRWREELAAGHSGDRSVALAMATAGRAVVFSGVTVAIGLLSMVMLPVPFLRSMGYAGMLIPLVSVLVTLTLLPVLLATIGQRADWPHRRKPPHVGRGWAAWARGVRRQRWLAVLAALAVLVPLGVAGLGLRLGTPNADALAKSGPAYEGPVMLEGAGVPTGVLTPLEVLVGPGIDPTEVADRLAQVPGVHAAVAPADPVWRRGGTAIVDVQPLAQTGTQAGKQTVTRTTAITEGIGRTGRLVTSAALILLLAFASLASGPIVTVKVFATGLGAGIFLDATAVRAPGPRAGQPVRPLELVATLLGRMATRRATVTLPRRRRPPARRPAARRLAQRRNRSPARSATASGVMVRSRAASQCRRSRNVASER
jgi:RND superfamily putative drug exporter